MKKLTLLFLIFCLFSIKIMAQNLENVKKEITSTEWRLLRYEVGKQFYTVPKDVANTRMIFKTDGTLYRFIPPQTAENGEKLKWTVNENFLTIINGSKKNFFKYRVEDFIGMKFYLEEIETDLPHVKVFMDAKGY